MPDRGGFGPSGDETLIGQRRFANLGDGDLVDGRYKITKLLGRGGMAIVFEVEDELLDGARRALNILDPGISEDGGTSRADSIVARFKREVVLGQERLHHPCIVKVFGYGREGKGPGALHYALVELVEAPTLAAALAGDRPFKAAELPQLFDDLASALAFAHGCGVVHRDVKPSNIFVVEEGGRRRFRLADFGIARVQDDLTVSSVPGGGPRTVFYCAPEQARGGEIGPWTDVYLFGLVAYEVVHHGRRQWDATDPENPFPEGTPEWLEEVIRRCLRRNSEDRPGGGEALVGSLKDGPRAAERQAEEERRRIEVEQEKAAEAERRAEAERQRQEEAAREVERSAAEDRRKREAEKNAAEVKEAAQRADAARKERAERQQEAEQQRAAEQARLAQVRRQNEAAAERAKTKIAPARSQAPRKRMEVPPAVGVLVVFVVLAVIVVIVGVTVMLDRGTSAPTRAASVVTDKSGRAAGAGFTEASIGMKFRYIPPGEFEMGSPPTEADRDSDEGPVHRVKLTRGFWMGETEVTQGEWKALTGSNPSGFSSCGDFCPVEQVSWFDAVKYANALSGKAGLPECYGISGESVRFVGLGCEGYRLPTEAEWEYAARAGGRHRYSGGDEVGSVAWYFDNSGSKTHRAGEKRANAWGLHDMSGNVYEWCWDWFGDYPAGSVSDPIGPSSGSNRVLRGGSWYSSAGDCRSADRSRNSPGSRNGSLGLRLVRTAR